MVAVCQACFAERDLQYHNPKKHFQLGMVWGPRRLSWAVGIITWRRDLLLPHLSPILLPLLPKRSLNGKPRKMETSRTQAGYSFLRVRVLRQCGGRTLSKVQTPSRCFLLENQPEQFASRASLSLGGTRQVCGGPGAPTCPSLHLLPPPPSGPTELSTWFISSCC